MAVVEGYTDVIAAHQVGLCNVVGTLGTALGEDHFGRCSGWPIEVVLVFDGDEAGQSAADRALEFFLGSELDLRVLTLPANLDPCDFLLKEGADAFRDAGRAGGRSLGLPARPGRGPVRPRLDRRLAPRGRVGPGHHEPRARDPSAWDSKSSRPRSSTRCRIGCAFRSRRSTGCAGSCGARPCRHAAIRGRSAVRTGRVGNRPSRRPRPAGADPPERARPHRPGVDPDRLERAGGDHLADSSRRRLDFAGCSAAGDPPGVLRPSERGAVAQLREPHGPARRSGDPSSGCRV